MICKKGVLKKPTKFTGKYRCWSVFLVKLKTSGFFIKKETSTQVFSCEFCEILSTVFYWPPHSIHLPKRNMKRVVKFRKNSQPEVTSVTFSFSKVTSLHTINCVRCGKIFLNVWQNTKCFFLLFSFRNHILSRNFHSKPYFHIIEK